MPDPHARTDRRLTNPLLRAAAACVEPFYKIATSLRNAAFDRGWRDVASVHVPVVSVGNLTAGGTGKTPMVIHVVRHLRDHGLTPAVVLRGYKASAELGSDEQRELEAALSGTPVIANPDRVAAAAQIAVEHPGVDCIVLDDGFQHRRIARDLDLVLIDATDPFGGGRILPRGLLRERPDGLERADAVVVTRCDRVDAGELERIDLQVERYHGVPPTAHAEHAWTGVVDQNDEAVTSDKARVFAVAAIGNPAAFFAQAGERFTLVGSRARPDHADYSALDLTKLTRAAADAHADALLVTPKDWVKLRPLVESAPPAPGTPGTAGTLPVWRPTVELRFRDGESGLSRLLIEACRGNR